MVKKELIKQLIVDFQHYSKERILQEYFFVMLYKDLIERYEILNRRFYRMRTGTKG